MNKKEKQDEVFDKFLIENTVFYTRVPDYFKNREAYKPYDEKVLTAFIPGTIRDMEVKEGDIVQKGDKLMILDAMKMNNVVRALFDGKIKSIKVKVGDMVRKNQTIMEFE